MAADGLVPLGDTLRIRIEDDLLFVQNLGVLTLLDFKLSMNIYEQIWNNYGTLFVIYDSTRGQGMHRDARAAIFTFDRSKFPANPDATAIFGASFAARTLGNMLDRAMLGLGKSPTGIRYVSTESDARAYIARERERVYANRRFGLGK